MRSLLGETTDAKVASFDSECYHKAASGGPTIIPSCPSCSYAWPTLDPRGNTLRDTALFLRSYRGSAVPYSRYLLPSLWIFLRGLAPHQTVVVLDDDAADRAYGANLSQAWPWPTVAHRQVEHGLEPHVMQQGAYLYADTYLPAGVKYVAMLDTDSLFTTPVERDGLFDSRGRPYIIGQVGREPPGSVWHELFKWTAAFLKQPEAMRAMSYFPLVFKVEHLKELRDHVSRLHGGVSFDKIWLNVSLAVTRRGAIAAFNAIVNYLYFHHRNEYNFRLQQLCDRQD